MNGVNEVVRQLGRLMKEHGFRTTQRALVCLASAAIFVAETGEDPTVEALSTFWNQNERTTYRETSAWRKVTGDADLAEHARRVAEAMDPDLLRRENAEAMTLGMVPFLPV